jgi:Tol biopolymer transport system component
MKHTKPFLLFVFFLASCAAPVTPTPTSTPKPTPVKPVDFLQTSDAYLGQTPPGDMPIVFAPDVVSIPDKNTTALTFSPDGRQCIFYINNWSSMYAMFTEFQDGKWTTPIKAWFSETRSVGEPMFSPDGKRIYFTSNEVKTAVGGFGLWYVERSGTLWSEPVNLGTPVNTTGDEFHPSPIADGSIYFTNSSGATVRSQYENGKYLEPVVLPEPINLKSTASGTNYNDAYVSPDESYMIFRSKRSGGNGVADNYISYRNADGSWSEPKNLGSTINSASDEASGDISPDGKYMFFGRGGLIYWVKADFISALR